MANALKPCDPVDNPTALRRESRDWLLERLPDAWREACIRHERSPLMLLWVRGGRRLTLMITTPHRVAFVATSQDDREDAGSHLLALNLREIIALIARCLDEPCPTTTRSTT